MIQNWKSKYRRRSFKGPAPASQIILLNTERGDTETANSLARNEETYFGMILYDFSCRGHQSINILFLKTETVGSIYLYVREKTPTNFHCIQ